MSSPLSNRIALVTGASRDFGYAIALASFVLGSVQAQEVNPNPKSVDPVLRHLQLEKERVAPQGSPGLEIAPVPGKVSYVLHPKGEKQDEPPSPLMVLRVPASYFSQILNKPVETFDLWLIVQYPSMAKMPPHSCKGWCEGQISLSIENRRAALPTVPQIRYDALREDMERQRKLANPLVAYTSITPLPDFDEAFRLTYPAMAFSKPEIAHASAKEAHFKKNADGQVIEFVECRPNNPSPACTTWSFLPRQPKQGIQYTTAMNPAERDAVAAAVLKLVDSFYDRTIPR